MADTRTLRDYLASTPAGEPSHLVGADLMRASRQQFATAAQGSKADSAVQPGDLASTSAPGVVELATDAEARAATSGKAFTTDLIESASALGTLTDASTVSVDWDTFINATLTAADNRTIGNPTNVQPGTYRSFWIFGNNSTERAISWGSNFAGPLPEETVTSTKGLHITLHARTTTSIDVFWKVCEP